MCFQDVQETLKEIEINSFPINETGKEIFVCANCLKISINTFDKMETVLKPEGNFFWHHCPKCDAIIGEHKEGRI